MLYNCIKTFAIKKDDRKIYQNYTSYTKEASVFLIESSRLIAVTFWQGLSRIQDTDKFSAT